MSHVTMQQCLGLSTDHLIEFLPGFMAQASAVTALHALQEDAKKQGFDLQPCSAFRSFERQAFIFSRKFAGERQILDINEEPLEKIPDDPVERLQAILLFSAMPGFSRHHFGSDFDVYAPNMLPEGQQLQLTYHEYSEGAYFHEFGEYLKENLGRFDFVNPYDGKKTQLLGPEPWHVSHLPSSFAFIHTYDIEQALSYVEGQADLAFAPYVRQVMTEERIEAVLQLSLR